MANHFEIKTSRPGKDGKTYWTRIGTLFPLKGKEGFSIVLDALPLMRLGQDGQLRCEAVALPPFEDDGKGQRPARRAAPAGGGDSLDDEIPF